MQLTWAYSFLYWTTISFASLSVLALCRRIFFICQSFWVSSKILLVLITAWWLSGSICDAVSYQPARAWWDVRIPGHYAIDYNTFWLASMTLELLLELASIILPIRQVAKLRLSRRKRILLIVIFSTGGLVVVSGSFRIFYVLRQSMIGIFAL